MKTNDTPTADTASPDALYAGACASGRDADFLRFREAALNRLRVSREAGVLLLLGRMHLLGQGVPASALAALEYYVPAAELGEPEARRQLGDICADALNELPADWRGMRPETFDFSDPVRMRELAFAYENGAVDDPGSRRAFFWYGKAARMGDAEAQCLLATMYRYGSAEGHPKDPEAALRWMQASAEQGYRFAQADLGGWYLDGTLSDPDERLGAAWALKAALQGDAYGLQLVSRCCEEGEGLPQNADLAGKLAELADRAECSETGSLETAFGYTKRRAESELKALLGHLTGH